MNVVPPVFCVCMTTNVSFPWGSKFTRTPSPRPLVEFRTRGWCDIREGDEPGTFSAPARELECPVNSRTELLVREALTIMLSSLTVEP